MKRAEGLLVCWKRGTVKADAEDNSNRNRVVERVMVIIC